MVRPVVKPLGMVFKSFICCFFWNLPLWWEINYCSYETTTPWQTLPSYHVSSLHMDCNHFVIIATATFIVAEFIHHRRCWCWSPTRCLSCRRLHFCMMVVDSLGVLKGNIGITDHIYLIEPMVTVEVGIATLMNHQIDCCFTSLSFVITIEILWVLRNLS